MDVRVTRTTGRPGQPGQRVVRARRSPGVGRVGVAQAAFALIVPYALVGAGIGAACGSAYVGLVVGAFTGICAAGAILLISGAALTGEPLPVAVPAESMAAARSGIHRQPGRRAARAQPPIRISS